MRWWRRCYIDLIRRYIDDRGLPQIIHAHTYLAGWVGAALKDIYGIPVIISEHATLILNDEVSPVHHKIAQEAYSKADHTMAVSSALAKKIEETYKVPVSICPNFIDPDLFKKLRRTDTNTTKYHIITVGDLIVRKQTELAIQSIKGLGANVHLTIVGDGPQKEKLMTLCTELGVDDRVHFTGRLSQKQLATILPTMDLLVHPSSSETFGIVLIEALFCGVPVIALDNGGARDIINEANGLILYDSSTAAWQRAIKQMISLRAEYDPTAIRLAAVLKFGPETVSQQLIKIYSQIVRDRQ